MIYKTNQSARIRFNANGTDACVLTTCGALATYFTQPLPKPIDLKIKRDVVLIETTVRSGKGCKPKNEVLWFQVEEIYKAV